MEDKKEVLEEKPKTKNGFGPGFMVILVVLFLVGIGLGFAASKILDEPSKEDNTEEKEKKNKKKEEKEEVKEESLDVKSEQVTSLFHIITNSNRSYCGYYGLFTNKKMTANDISSEDRDLMMLDKIYGDLYKKDNQISTGTTYTKAEVEKVYKGIFGKDMNMEHATIRSCPSFIYDSSKETYAVGEHNCGGTCGPYATVAEVEKATKKGEIIELDIKMLFSDGNAFYNNYEKTQTVEVPEGQYGPEPLQVIKEKGTSYKATFKLEDGNYVFVSVEPVK